MNPIILETMNDIINQVEARGWRDLNGHRDRLLKKMRKQSEKIEYWKTATGEAEDKLDDQMKENEEMHEALQTDWAVATEKIGQENSDLHNEIKRLKDQIKEYENRWKMFNVERELEITLLTAEYGSEEIRNCMKENENLKSALMNSSGSFKCDECCIHLTEDDVYRSVDEGRLLCESCSEGDE